MIQLQQNNSENLSIMQFACVLLSFGFVNNGKYKAAVCNFLWLKMIRNQYLSKYITSQCSKLSPYFSPIHNG